MIDRLKVLVKLQMTNKTRKYSKGSLRKYRDNAITVVIAILFTVAVYFLLYVVDNIFFISVNVYFMIFIILLTQTLSIIAAVSGLVVDIYESKDNQILLTLPANNDEIFLSKLVVYFIHEYKKNFYFLFPFLVAYGFINSMGFWYFVGLIPMIFILPFISVFLSSIFSIVITFVKNFIKRYSWINLLLIFALIFLLFYFIYNLVESLPDSIRIVQLYNSFIASLAQFMQTVASYGTIYSLIGKILNGQNVIVYYLIVIGTMIVLFLINYLVSKPLFFRMTSKTNENAKTKKHKPKEEKEVSLFMTFFRKEIIIARRSLNELLSNYGVLISLPIVIYVLNSIYTRMDTSSLGNSMVLIFNVLIILVLLTASNTASAVAITTEGYEFILLKTAPSKTKQVAWAKMAFNFIFTSLLLFISFILLRFALPMFSSTDIWALFLFSFFFNTSQIFWSFELDILNPKLADYAATGSLSNNDNIAKTLSNGFIAALFFTIICAFAFLAFDSIAWIALNLLGLMWLLFRFWSFKTHLDVYFNDIEY